MDRITLLDGVGTHLDGEIPPKRLRIYTNRQVMYVNFSTVPLIKHPGLLYYII